MSSSIKYSILFFMLISCVKEEVKNYPISYGNKNSFLEISKKNNKKILEYETQQIESYIQKRDTLEYKYLGDGYWMAKMDSTQNKNITSAIDNDEILYSYSIFGLNDDIIYTKEEIGNKKDILGKAFMFRGLYFALQKIKEGERVSLIFPSALAYGFFGDENKIKPLSPIVLDLKINKIKYSDD